MQNAEEELRLMIFAAIAQLNNPSSDCAFLLIHSPNYFLVIILAYLPIMPSPTIRAGYLYHKTKKDTN